VIAQKNISYSMQATDAVALVRQAVEHAAKVRAEVPVTLEEPAALPTVEADANALREALQDLILGAAAVLPGTQQIAVTLTAETVDAHGASLLGIQPGDHIRVRIRHSHAATRPIVRERLFDPYYTHDGKGKGAELSLGRAWGIVAVHKGTIAVTPQSPEATVTDIFLPVLGHVQGRKHAGTVGE
jgi:signal transduction histidine kinase